MRRYWIGAAAALVVGLGADGAAKAQPQDDAALAEVPNEKPPPDEKPTVGDPSYSTAPSPAPKHDDAPQEPPMTTTQLRQAYPDLQLRVTPPPKLTFFLSSILPFQTVGLGLGFDVYGLPRLRLSVVGAAGALEVVNQGGRASLYGEAGVGIVVLRWLGQTIAELPSFATRNFHSSRTTVERMVLGEEQPPAQLYAHAVVPTSHSIELEGGLFSGLYPLYRCTENCDADPAVAKQTKEDASRQMTVLYAGVRYVYYRSASSGQAPFRSMAAFEVAVDALSNPLKPVNADLFNLYDHHPADNPVGVRLKLHFAGLRCAPNGLCGGINLMGGYLPSPSDALASVNLEIQ